MNKGLSTYLDALRFSAALAVFFRHLSFSNVSGGFLWQLYPFGHDAVVIFFVLSGFVIAYVTDTKEATIGEYMSARLARLYSVVLPALAVTFICDFVGIRHHPQVYDLARETEPTLRLLASGLFISQSWGWQLDTLSNDAYWSLPYEF
jgi:peptidoglycan/LPS O-acetylase OafA/YrhL